MQRIIDIMAVPGCAYVGCKASIILWPADHLLAILTAGAFLILFCDFILEAIEPRKTKP